MQAKAFQYPVLLSRAVEAAPLAIADGGDDPRVPWDVLVNLKDRIPQADTSCGDFSYVILRINELFDAANAWQEEISDLTMLSLGGRKRRQQSPSKTACDGPAEDEDSGSTQLDLGKVLELSHDPILREVRTCVARLVEAVTTLMVSSLHQGAHAARESN